MPNNSNTSNKNNCEEKEKEKEEISKSKSNSENQESLINIDNIIIPENIIEKNNKGIITYKGLNDPEKKINVHYIYLSTEKEINNKNEKEEKIVYKWKIKFIKFSDKKNYIGIGLAEKDIVLKNKNIFFNSLVLLLFISFRKFKLSNLWLKFSFYSIVLKIFFL